MVERAALEMRFRLNPNVGSNPTPSAMRRRRMENRRSRDNEQRLRRWDMGKAAAFAAKP